LHSDALNDGSGLSLLDGRRLIDCYIITFWVMPGLRGGRGRPFIWSDRTIPVGGSSMVRSSARTR